MMRTTKKHFEIFKEECQKWIKRFELSDWQIYFEHGGQREGAFATSRFKQVGGVVTIFFADEWAMDVIDNMNESIKVTAKHEMTHVLMGRFSGNAHSRYLSEVELEESEEALVRKLEKLL